MNYLVDVENAIIVDVAGERNDISLHSRICSKLSAYCMTQRWQRG